MTPSTTTSTTAPPDREPLAPLHTALRILAIVVLALMLISIVYAGWIAVANWGTIRV